VDGQVAERKTVEYKAALPTNADDSKKEFLADVSSFANASGGNLIFGIEAKDGVPTKVSGLDVPSADAAVLRLDNMVREGIRERIPGHYTRAIFERRLYELSEEEKKLRESLLKAEQETIRWEEVQSHIQYIKQWVADMTGVTLTYEQKRMVLYLLGVRVEVFVKGHAPRVRAFANPFREDKPQWLGVHFGQGNNSSERLSSVSICSSSRWWMCPAWCTASLPAVAASASTPMPA
jgi:hypothetical protein